MKNRTKNPQKESLEANSGSGTSMKAAVISILVLHLAIGIGFISQGCKKENSSNSSDLVDKKTNDSENQTTPSTGTGNGSSTSQGMEIPDLSNAGSLLNEDRNSSQNRSAPPNYQGSYPPSNQGSSAQGSPRVPRELPITEQSGSGDMTGEVKTVPPPPVVNKDDGKKSFIVPDAEVLDPQSELNGSYGQASNTNQTSNSGSPSASTSYNSGANSRTNSGAANPSAHSESGFKTVTIEKGDTIGKYARENNTTVEAIQKLNPQITDLGRIQIGWKVRIPVNSAKPSQTPPGSTTNSGSSESNKPSTSASSGTSQGVVYEVQKGDNLYNIGVKYGIPWKEIMEFNNLKTANLNIGQKLKIPAK